jgi:chromate transporter
VSVFSKSTFDRKAGLTGFAVCAVLYLLASWQALKGVNAAVVGLLLAALYDPVWKSGIATAGDFALAVSALVLLAVWKLSPWLVVVFCALGGAGLAYI